MRPFNLIRYFTLASLAVIAVLAIAIAIIFSRNLERSLTHEAGQYARDISRSLNHTIWSDFLEPLEASRQPLDLTNPAQRQRLDALVADRIRGLRIQSVILFDRSATVIYSNQPEYVGHSSLHNPGIASALAGETATFLKRAELEAERMHPGHDLLESYSPFYARGGDGGDEDEIVGVLELYQDARPITSEIAAGQRQILLATAGLMLFLFVALFAIVRRGDVGIRQLTEALERSNRELEDRVRARTREIETARHRLRSLFDGIADGISVIDAEFRVAEWNAGIERLFGPGSARSTEPCYVRYAGRADACPGCPARVALETGKPAERRYRWPTAGEGPGAAAEVEVTTFPFTTASGEPAVIEVVRDVRERAELERQILQSANLASLGEMAAGVAHEIRNPIGMIQSSAQLLAAESELAERDRRLLDVIQTETARLNMTISEFVSFASPPEPTRAVTDAGALLERVRTMLQPQAQQSAVTLAVALDAGAPKIQVDPELMYRALTNLVLNAIQAQEGGGRVELSVSHSEARGVAIHVLDHGPGIPQAEIERIFQPFYTRRSSGTGLGLSIVERIVSANGGRITVSSGSAGTEFVIHFSGVGA